MKVREAMAKTIRTAAPADEDLETAAQVMERAAVRRLAVVEGGRLVGVLSHGTLVQALQGGGPATQATVGVTQGA